MDGVYDTLAKTLIGLGPGGLIAAYSMWRLKLSDDERKGMQEKLYQLLQSTTDSRVQLATSLERLAQKIGA